MLLFILLIILVGYLLTRMKIVQQSEAFIIERMGSYYQTWHNGIHFLMPFIDKIVHKVSLKETVLTLDPQSVITKDNVSMTIDTIMYTQITDPKAATYGVDDVENALRKSVGTALRNVVGELELDQTLSERDIINAKMQSYMDKVTGPWGIKVNRVELKDVRPPKEIQATMERQMKAERERRAQVTESRGAKEAQVLKAEAEAEAVQKQAEGQAKAQVTQAQAQAQAMEARAQGQANAIKTVQTAYSSGLKSLNDNGVLAQFIRLQSFDAMKGIADGNATKLIVPSDMQDFTTKSMLFKESDDSSMINKQ